MFCLLYKRKAKKIIEDLKIQNKVIQNTIETHKNEVKIATQDIRDMINRMEELETFNQILKELIPTWYWVKEVVDCGNGKYISGKYISANKLIREELFCGKFEKGVLGKTDVQLAEELRSEFGIDNHTFGEPCMDSDQQVIDSRVKGTFAEYGKVKGHELFVVVYKNVITDVNGKPVATVGIGVNITEDRNTLVKIMDTTKDEETKTHLRHLIEKNDFSKDKSCVVM